MSFKSILSDIGTGFKGFFTDATTVAKDAEPIIDIAFPGISVLYSATIDAISSAENAAIVAGRQSGSGAQKLALVIMSIESSFNAYAAANGLATPSEATIAVWVNAVVAGLNAIPSTATV